MILLKSVTKTFGKNDSSVHALNRIDLTIHQGEMLAIMGPSGSGKSTLLNMIGCLDVPTSGEYLFNGRSIIQYSEKQLAVLRNRQFGFIVQDFSLIDKYTVFQNVTIPLHYCQKRIKNKRILAFEVLSMLGIEEKIDATADKLSGGQKQRTAIARALINNPEIILADEPTGSLDQKSGQDVLNILKKIHLDGKTIVMVTHDRHIARQCDRVVNIVDGHLDNPCVNSSPRSFF